MNCVSELTTTIYVETTAFNDCKRYPKINKNKNLKKVHIFLINVAHKLTKD